MWDEELAATAQSWADQCVPAHDRASQRDVLRFQVGQNIAATWTTRPPSSSADSQPDFGKQINAWFDEVRIFGFKPINGAGHGTGHYSQVNIILFSQFYSTNYLKVPLFWPLLVVYEIMRLHSIYSNCFFCSWYGVKHLTLVAATLTTLTRNRTVATPNCMSVIMVLVATWLVPAPMTKGTPPAVPTASLSLGNIMDYVVSVGLVFWLNSLIIPKVFAKLFLNPDIVGQMLVNTELFRF